MVDGSENVWRDVQVLDREHSCVVDMRVTLCSSLGKLQAIGWLQASFRTCGANAYVSAGPNNLIRTYEVGASALTERESEGGTLAAAPGSDPENSYIWDALSREGISFRNYGFWATETAPVDIRNRA